MTPELRRLERKTADANKAMRNWNTDFDELARLCAIVQSHMVSAGEAAWREDTALVRTHLGHADAAMRLAWKVMK